MRKQAHDEREALYALNDVDGIIFKLKQDPRITTVGRFFKKIQHRRVASVDQRRFGGNESRGSQALSVRGFRATGATESVLCELAGGAASCSSRDQWALASQREKQSPIR